MEKAAEKGKAKKAEDGATPTQVKVLDAPEFYASALQGFWAGNDFTIVFHRPCPAQANGKSAAVLTHSAILHLSPGTAKDLMLVMQTEIAKREKEFGEIETGFTRGKAEKSRAEKKK